MGKVSILATKFAVYNAIVGAAFYASGYQETGGVFFKIAAGSLAIGAGAGILAELAFTASALAGGLLFLSQRSPQVRAIWDKQTDVRGRELHNMYGENLPKGFPTIDRISDRIVTSIKTKDLRTFSISQLRSEMNKDLSSLLNFTERKFMNRTILRSDYDHKEYHLIVPSSITKEQSEEIGRMAQEFLYNGMFFRLTVH